MNKVPILQLPHHHLSTVLILTHLKGQLLDIELSLGGAAGSGMVMVVHHHNVILLHHGLIVLGVEVVNAVLAIVLREVQALLAQ